MRRLDEAIECGAQHVVHPTATEPVAFSILFIMLQLYTQEGTASVSLFYYTVSTRYLVSYQDTGNDVGQQQELSSRRHFSLFRGHPGAEGCNKG